MDDRLAIFVGVQPLPTTTISRPGPSLKAKRSPPSPASPRTPSTASRRTRPKLGRPPPERAPAVDQPQIRGRPRRRSTRASAATAATSAASPTGASSGSANACASPSQAPRCWCSATGGSWQPPSTPSRPAGGRSPASCHGTRPRARGHAWGSSGRSASTRSRRRRGRLSRGRQGRRLPSRVLPVLRRKGDKFHQTGKPTALMEALVKVCPAGGLVLDPFAGRVAPASAPCSGPALPRYRDVTRVRRDSGAPSDCSGEVRSCRERCRDSIIFVEALISAIRIAASALISAVRIAASLLSSATRIAASF